VIPLNESLTTPALYASSGIGFYGRRRDFVRLVLRGAALELVTFGFYRFWLATDIRRHLWSNTAVEGDVLEYTGVAKELLIGFLFALAILVPVYLVYFIIGLEAERLQAFASVPLILFFYLFAQFAMYRARRYRLTRTVWRGVRFWMRGSGSVYALRAGLWSLLVVLTLFLALPWRQAALERYKMGHTFYGSLPARFVGTGGNLFTQAWWLWVITAFMLIAQTGVSVSPQTRFLAPFLATAFAVSLPFLYATYRAIEWRWWIGGVRFGGVELDCKLRRGALIAMYWKIFGWGFLLFLLLAGWFAALAGLAFAQSGDGASSTQVIAVLQQPSMLIGFGLGYVAVALGIGVVWRVYLLRDLWALLAASTTVFNLAAAENVAARGDLVSGLGEGLADNLDVAGF
jgi:uncharacterized membrane protein YjgN (DUF898 family)